MKDYQMKYSYKKTVLIVATVIIITNMVMISMAFKVANSLYQKETISTTRDFIFFQSDLIKLMETGSVLLAGYEAYLMVNKAPTDEESEVFLNYLTRDESKYIRNITILEDTTVYYSYPQEKAGTCIGTDLAKVPQQKEVVLRTKNSMQGSFLGPIELIKGGQGFVIRRPIKDENGDYWGQLGIILKLDEIIRAIESYAVQNKLEVTIYEKDQLILGDASLRQDQPLFFNINSELNDWVIYVRPLGGWVDHESDTFYIILAGVIMSLVLGVGTYLLLKMNYNLKYSLAHDQLTNLYNRYYLAKVQKDICHHSIEDKTKYGLLHADLNAFKNINDFFGHEAGDEVLVETARLFNELTRSEEIVFRVGGDEFLIILPLIKNKVDLVHLKNRLKKEFKEGYRLEKYGIDIGPSMGVGIYPDDGNDFDAVLKSADKAMYTEKEVKE